MSWNPVVLEPENGGTGGVGSIKLPPIQGDNQIVDGAMEIWDGVFSPDDWFTLGGTVSQITGVTGFGLDLVSSGFGIAGVQQQSPFGLNPGDFYTVTAQVMDVSIGIHGSFAYTSHVGSDDVIFNFTTQAWDVFTGTPTSDQLSAFSLTPSVFTLQTSAQVFVPTSGYFSVVLATGEAGELAFDDVTLELSAGGSNLLTNGDFELWTNTLNTPNLLTDWSNIVAGGGHNLETLQAETTIVHEGTYSAHITNDSAMGYSIILEQTTPITGLTPDKEYIVSFYARCAEGEFSTKVLLAALNGPSGTADKIFNWDNGTWESFTDFGSIGANQTWTDFAEGVSGDFTQYIPSIVGLTTGNITVPASGSINILVGGNPGDTGDKNVYIDTVYLGYTTPSPIVTFHDLVNKTSMSNAVDGDSFFKVHTDGGTPFLGMDMRANGDWYSEFPRWQFKDFVLGQDLVGVEDTDYAVRSEVLVSDHLIGFAENIDLTATGLTTLTGVYGISAFKKLINAYIVIETVTANTVTVPPVLGCGTVGGSYTDVVNGSTLDTGMTTVGAYETLPLTTTVKQIITAAHVKFNVTTGATAVAFTANVYLFGTLLNV